MLRIGIGVDAHRRIPGRPLWLGGVEIPADFGLEAHSDGDVICHAIIEALLGASNLGDKGRLFPPSDPQYENIRSTVLLQRVVNALEQSGFKTVNIDVSVMCEEPRISNHVSEMQNVLSKVLRISPADISIKGTTLERLGFTGRKEGIAALAVGLIQNGNAA